MFSLALLDTDASPRESDDAASFKVLESLRPLRSPAFKFSADTVALLAALDGWLSETHFLPQTVVTLWNSAARSRLQQVVRNPGRERGGKGAVLKAAKAVINPLFNAGLVLFPPGSNLDTRRFSVTSMNEAYTDEHAVAEAEAVAAAKMRRTESYGPNAIPLSERSPESLLKDQPNWSDRYALCNSYRRTHARVLSQGHSRGAHTRSP